MKRSELKRGDSQLNRTPMKKRRTRHQDTKESLSLRAEYEMANGKCEVTAFLRAAIEAAATFEECDAISEWKASKQLRYDSRPCQTDHLWGGTAGRRDVLSMLIVTEAAWHEWKTAHFTEGLLLFLIVKANKKPPEINAAEFKACSGFELSGWLSLDKTISACPPWLDPFRRLLIASLETVQ